MSEATTYSGGCHCGAVRFDVTMEMGDVIACNCSMCGKSGTLLAFVEPGQFTLKSGEGSLAEYLFNKHVIRHHFCKVCGIKPFARGVKRDGSPMIAINTRCLDDVDIETLSIKHVDGRSW